MRSIRKPASMYISLCTFVCILQRVGARVCAHAKGSERGFGWGRSSPRPPGCCCGEPGGGQPAAPGSLPLLGGSGGGSSAVLQTEASLRNTDSHFRGRVAEELSALLQSWKEASFCREPVTSRPPPGSSEGLPPLCHTPACATQKHCWSFLESPGEHVHMDANCAGAEWGRIGA